MSWGFASLVALPTLLAGFYYGLIASDVYVSESRFVLRSPQRQAATGLGAILQSAGFKRAQDDTYAVGDYIVSRDALRVLDKEFGLRKSFGSASVDLLSRFAAIDGDDSFEAMHLYYQKRVSVVSDAASAITTLRFNSFSAAEARAVNERLLQMSEALVNALNERARRDLIRFAEQEVVRAQDVAKAAAIALAEFQSRNSVYDPIRQSGIQLQLVSRLQDELILSRTQLEQLRRVSRESSLIQSIEQRIRSLQSAISTENAKVTGTDRSLSEKSGEFLRLTLDREFAEKQFATAMSMLEQAKNEAQRKQLYLERIVQPSLSDRALEPRRIRGVVSTLLLGLVAWGILTMLIAGIREHRD